MQTTYSFKFDLPYSLHDSRICGIALDNNNIRLTFDGGYTALTAALNFPVDGDVTLFSADPEFCEVHLLSFYGQTGAFEGEKLSLEDFIARYPQFTFEVVDELFSYNQLMLTGFITVPGCDDLREMTMSVYFTGNIVFNTQQ